MKFNVILFAILALFFASCSSNNGQKIQDISHDEVKIQLIGYSNEFELFAEADPLVVGKTSNILSHFSHLPDFHALEKGSMTIRLIVSGNEVSQTLSEPTRKGIYSFELKPEKEGSGKLLFDITTETAEFQLIVPDIYVFAEEKDAIRSAQESILSKTNTTVFTKEQSWKINFATENPKVQPFGQVIKTTAQVQSAQGDEVIVSARINGIVKLTTENILEGRRVSKGQELFSISGQDLADNNSSVRYFEAKNNFEKTQADYERLSELAKDKIVSEKKLLEAKNQYDNAKVIFDNLSKNFNSNGQSVKSSMNGYVKQLFVKNGQYIEAGQPTMIISQNKTLLLKAEVQQKFASILGAVNSANIRSLHDNKTYSFEQLNGKVISFGRNTNNENYLIPLSLQIDNVGDFISGSFVELYLKSVTNIQAITIPNSSLMEEYGVYFVFVQITPELFEKREVMIGGTDGLKTEILKGITTQERIVTSGAIHVKLAQASGTLDANSGHNH